jgi:hypothetical protein
MEDRFQLMLEMQRQLQLKMPPPNRVPADLRGDDMADFMRWNAWACEDEIHEAMAEVGWKPWATSRHINHDAFMKEMVDAWHFFMNLLLCGCQGMTPTEIADEFTRRYIEKNAVNAQRQEEGYDGVKDKCAQCHRDLGEVDPLARYTLHGRKFCNVEHAQEYADFAAMRTRER